MHVEDLDLPELMRRMALIREFEAKAEQFMDRGLMFGSIHSSAGQEAVCVGACAALRDDDFMTGHHRSHGHPIAKGADVGGLLAELLGRRAGVCHGNGGSMHLADFSVGSLGESAIVGSSMAIATGAGLSIRQKGEDKVCLAFFGDGAANAGICHESFNLAAIWKLPVVFVCENNLYAVTMSHSDACSVDQISTRAAGYGMPGVTVDGQDVLAVHAAVAEAVDRARAGEGPSLVEAMTYRYDAHSYRLSTLGNRSDDELAQWRSRDPLDLFAAYLEGTAGLAAAEVQAIRDAARAEIEAAAEAALASPFPTMDEAYADLYVEPLPAHLAAAGGAR